MFITTLSEIRDMFITSLSDFRDMFITTPRHVIQRGHVFYPVLTLI